MFQCLDLATLDVSTEPKEGEVLVQWLAAPVNPLDINRVEGNYAMKEQLPAIGGSEGAGRIIKVVLLNSLYNSIKGGCWK